MEEIENEIEEEIEEEEKYNPYEDDDIFSITAKKIDILFKKEVCLSSDCKKDIEIYDVSYVYTYPHHKFKTFEVGIKIPVYMHVALWKELLKACKLMEFVGEETFSEDNCILYRNKVQFDVPSDHDEMIRLFKNFNATLARFKLVCEIVFSIAVRISMLL